jgi:hypothetical protein
MAYKYSWCTLWKTRRLSITNSNRLMLFMKSIAVYCGDHKKEAGTVIVWAKAKHIYIAGEAGGAYSNPCALDLPS